MGGFPSPTTDWSGVPQSATEAPLSRGFLSRALTENRCPKGTTGSGPATTREGLRSLASPSLFSVRGSRQRARGRHEGLQANSRQRSARASSYGVLPRSDPQGRESRAQTQLLTGHALSGQPGRTDVGPGWLQLGVCNARSSLGVSNAFTVVQKIALTALVDQAHNSNKRLLLHGPTAKPPFGSGLTLSDRFYTPTLYAPDGAKFARYLVSGFLSPAAFCAA